MGERNKAQKHKGARVYTRRGDSGTTSLLGAKRVPKNHPAVELNGTIDEAQSALGLARALIDDGALKDRILSLQRELWMLMGEVAARCGKAEMQTKVTKEMVNELESEIDRILEAHPLPKEFVLPGESPGGAALDLARTVVRRAERVAVGLKEDLEDSLVLTYLNRLSDLLFVLARRADGVVRKAKGGNV